MALVSDIITGVRYALIDTDATQWSDGELLNYMNECCEIIYQTLIDMESELVRTGTSTITTINGTEKYVLSDEGMSDLLTIHKIWIDTEDPMDMCEESDRFQYLKNEEDGDTSARTTPTDYYIENTEIGFLPFPDDSYNVNVIFYPAFTEFALTDDMPYKNLFNLQIKQGVALLAKNRNELGLAVEPILLDMYTQKAFDLTRKRRKKEYQMTPRFS